MALDSSSYSNLFMFLSRGVIKFTVYLTSKTLVSKWTLSALYLPSVDHQMWLPVKVLQKTKRKLVSGRKHYAHSFTAEDITHSTCKIRLKTSLSPRAFSCTTRTSANPALTHIGKAEDNPWYWKLYGHHHFQCCPGTAGFCLNFSLETLLRPLNSVHKVDKVKYPAPEPSLKIPVLPAQRAWN